MTVLDEGRYESVQQHDLPTAVNQLFVNLKLSLGGHRELQQVGMVAALAQHHEDVGHLDVDCRGKHPGGWVEVPVVTIALVSLSKDSVSVFFHLLAVHVPSIAYM